MGLVVLGLFVAAFMVACGGDDPTPTAAPAKAPAPAPTVAAKAAAPTPTSAPSKSSAPAPTPTVGGVFQGAEDIYAESGWQNDPRLVDLIAAAKAEGKVIYYSHSPSQVDSGCAGFMEMFPEIECIGKGLGARGISSGFIQEREAGVETADVMTTSMTLLSTVQDRGYLEDIDWGEFGVQDGRCLLNGNFCVRAQTMMSHMYNTDLVDPSELPTSFEGFLDPKWKDEIVASNFLYYQSMGYYCVVHGMEACLNLAVGLENDQKILITSGEMEVVINGEKKLLFLGNGVPVQERDYEDLPIDGWVTDDIGIIQFPIGVTDIAEHPNAARLLVLWAMSFDGSYVAYTDNALGCECEAAWPGYGHWPEGLLDKVTSGEITPIIQTAGLTAVSDDTIVPPAYDFKSLAAGGVAFRNARLGQN